MRDYERRAMQSGLIAVAALACIGLAVHASLQPGSPGPMQALFLPGLLVLPFAVVKCVIDAGVLVDARGMRNGKGVIAHWVVPAAELAGHRGIQQRLVVREGPDLHALPGRVPAEGLEVIFSDAAVLIGGFHFSLRASGGSRVRSARYIASVPPLVEFELELRPSRKVYDAQTHSHIRIGTLRGILRVPVASQAATLAEKVAVHYQSTRNPRVSS